MVLRAMAIGVVVVALLGCGGSESGEADYSSRLGDEHTAAIDGLADGAVYDSGFRGLAVDAGDGRYFVVAVGGGFGALDQPRDPLVELAHAVLGRLPGT